MHQIGAFTNYIDVAQVTLYGFWIFFAGLVFYLHREDKREGFPMVDSKGNLSMGFPDPPRPKTYLLPHGEKVMIPRLELPIPVTGAVPASGVEGAPLIPTGNPLVDGIGPAGYTETLPDHPHLTYDSGLPVLAPLRIAKEVTISEEDPDPRGMEVVASDGHIVGTVTDVWVDRSDTVFRYLEVPLAGVARTVLVPLPFVQFAQRGQLKVRALNAAQFAEIPQLKNPDSITMREEDRVAAYFGGGTLLGTPERAEPLL